MALALAMRRLLWRDAADRLVLAEAAPVEAPKPCEEPPKEAPKS
jgi:hypothetical protein